MKTEGLFSKVTRERVSSNPGRRSGDGRLESAWGRKAGRNRDSGEASHGRRQRTRRRARIGGLGSAKRGTEGTRELRGRRGFVHGARRRPEGKARARAPCRRHGAHGARGLGAISHETRNETHGEREGTTVKLTAGKDGGGDGSETAARAEVDGEIRRPRNDGCWGLRCVSGAKLERGSRGARGGARLPFNEAEGHEGGAPTTPGR